jgi:hypothetical protein
LLFLALLQCGFVCSGASYPELAPATAPNELIECSDREPTPPSSYDDLTATDPRRAMAPWTQDRRPVSRNEGVIRPALFAASDWARRECYLPCPHFQMCGDVRELPDETVSVYIRPNKIYEAIASGNFVLGPEAQVLIANGSGEVIDSVIYHSGCAWSDPSCHRASVPAAQ